MEILISEAEIAKRIAELGAELTAAYRGKPLTVIGIMNGATVFAADLLRRLDLPVFYDTIAIESYSGLKSSGNISFRAMPKLQVNGRHLLILDDVLDTGRTLLALRERFTCEGARSVRFCVAVEKDLPRPDGLQHADWKGFLIPDHYIVGYGMDADESYRNLPDICRLS